MEYALKNGKKVLIRNPILKDAQAIIHIISTADTETRFWQENLVNSECLLKENVR